MGSRCRGILWNDCLVSDGRTPPHRCEITLVEPIAIGIGIHVGEAIAGTIGSPDRMEFTFIGDVVNTAARIEGMTRALGASPLISADVLAALSPAAQGLGWVDVGTQGLKGKHEMVQLFGLHLGDPAAATSLPT